VSQAIPTGAVDTPLRVGESIATVLTMIADFDKGQGIYLRSVETLDKAISAQDQFDPMFHSQVTLRVRLNDREVRAIPDRIKDKVLEWALALERAGIKGKDFSFTEEEKHNARSTTFYLDNCHVEQVSNLGTNLKES